MTVREGSYADTPIGRVLIASEGGALIGLWLMGQKHFPNLAVDFCQRDTAVTSRVRRWLEFYFAGSNPAVDIAVDLRGTEFQRRVWQELRTIPYGQTVSYGELTRRIGLGANSVRAVAGAVGRNPVSIIVPCHRVVGADGSLTGYAGGMEAKHKLLSLEMAVYSAFPE